MERAAGQRAILVVEDETLIRMFAVATLQDAGFWVLEARDGAEALEILARNPDICLLVTDVRMPGRIDGLALVARVQRDHPAIRTIVVSGNASIQEAVKAGAAGYLAKPYMAHAMVRAVQDTLLRQ
jgi:DNA-binding NtrC family response regulator